jgi:hypothetical protein
LDREHGNLRAAMQWGLENRLEDLLQMIPLLAYFWNRRGYEEEARALIRDALQRSAQTPEFQGDAEPHRLKLVGKAWQTLAMLAYSQGDNIRAVAASAQAAQFARRLGDQELLALALGFEAPAPSSWGRWSTWMRS